MKSCRFRNGRDHRRRPSSEALHHHRGRPLTHPSAGHSAVTSLSARLFNETFEGFRREGQEGKENRGTHTHSHTHICHTPLSLSLSFCGHYALSAPRPHTITDKLFCPRAAIIPGSAGADKAK